MVYFSSSLVSLFILLSNTNNNVSSFTTNIKRSSTFTPLHMSFGLGPGEQVEEESIASEKVEKIAGIDYEIPDHELYRKSRLTKIDEKADDWFATLLGNTDDNSDENKDVRYPLGDVSKNIMKRILTPVVLQEDPIRSEDDPEWKPPAWTPRRLPWNPILPAYGLETYGIVVPRRNAEAWRHYDLPGLLATDYSLDPTSDTILIDDVDKYKVILQKKGYWLNDEQCTARLICINGQHSPSLSKTTDTMYNLQSSDFTNNDNKLRDEIVTCLEHLPDGYTDELPTEDGQKDIVEVGGSNKLSKLSGPNHNVGNATTQFAINNQQGTAIFAALNTVKTKNVALVDIPNDTTCDDLPILVVNAWTNNGGIEVDNSDEEEEQKGVAIHPRLLVLGGKRSKSSIIQGTIDLDDEDGDDAKTRPKFYNGYTQLYLREGSKLSHSYLEESGGYPTPKVEVRNVDADQNSPTPQEIESQRPALQNTHFDIIDVHTTGVNATYDHTCLGVGGNGRSRISMCTSMYQDGCNVNLNGFSLAGGAQRSDIRTTIHHISPNTQSTQIQKNMVGGRATTLFKGRIRIEEKATGSDSEQLSRTILLSDTSKVWAIPSLEIVPSEIKCSHGATVSDLSDEELFYLRSRGFDRLAARKLLMQAFLQECTTKIAPEILMNDEGESSLSSRLGKRLQGLIPQGDRKYKSNYQSV